MPRRVPILDDGWVLIATEEEITVRQRNAMRNSIIDAQTATYNLNAQSRTRLVELEKLRTPEDKEYEKRLTPQQREEAATNRRNTAALLAFRDLSPQDQTNITNHQRVKIRSYLRDWHMDKPIPVTDEDFDDLPEVVFDALFEACDHDLVEAPDTSDTPDNRADPKARTAG